MKIAKTELSRISAVRRPGRCACSRSRSWTQSLQVVFAGEEPGGGPGVVLVQDELDPVDVREPGTEIVGMASEGDANAPAMVFELPRPGAHQRLGLLEIAERLDALPRDDRQHHRGGDHLGEPAQRCLEDQRDRVSIDDLDPLEARQDRLGRPPGCLQGSAKAEGDVLRGQLAPVHGRPVVPAHAPPQSEPIGGLAQLGPRLRQIALDHEGPGGQTRIRPMPEQAAMGERVDDVGLVRVEPLEIEVRRVPGP
jgi:hypothetical protein